ncbi:cytochrome b [Celeribacter persicus]|uniref:Cytochrome b561 n=1 Tax=Celeribacter persicus TaxID=1651082 RepID=A0A2T5H9M8_9RHOB|nr:cytochrome b/b6 domain-containing protein [Celeribacter persicus]PTQ68290.1 cytochrome b561 [Celeribacter persicus]
MNLPSRLLDNSASYGLISRLFHWTLAALIIWQFIGMGLRAIFGRQPFVSFFVGTHQQVGTVIFMIVVLRVIWMLAMRKRRPSHGTGWLGLAAKAGHGALYLLMLLVPVAALIRAAGSTRGFAPFGFTIFEKHESEVSWMKQIGDCQRRSKNLPKGGAKVDHLWV